MYVQCMYVQCMYVCMYVYTCTMYVCVVNGVLVDPVYFRWGTDELTSIHMYMYHDTCTIEWLHIHTYTMALLKYYLCILLLRG